ncbi:hypothetical protein [Stigmatella aurantiaca]|uniref:Conserved uncharacterized protein n=1 Tax=Stigmatella aurantiaca (strain DW4/3-1) TaxID=378806 RepID=Q09AA8_STIAD|nr:hypothetical protein [Stigmatella aurantiaca]ADO75043.1 conserved uncharacterized protein [Stigmatella aurantiaca DW4/3-1]EAU68682.1 hypothetical protein STIAU_6018 [Stigmatella aurantiaca DW4/3-1]
MVHGRPKPRWSQPLSVLIAWGGLFTSVVFYMVFVSLVSSPKKGALFQWAVQYFRIANVAALVSLYAAVRHRSNVGLALFVLSLGLIFFYLNFSVS